MNPGLQDPDFVAVVEGSATKANKKVLSKKDFDFLLS